MKARFWLFVGMFLIVSARAFSADISVPCPEHKVGEVFKFAVSGNIQPGNSTIEIKSVNADGTMDVASLIDGTSMIYDRLFNRIKDGDGRVFSPKYYYTPECPFTLGSTVEYKDITFIGRSAGSQIVGTFKMNIAPEMEAIEVPAGKMNAIRVETLFDFTWSNGMRSGSSRDRIITYYSAEKGVPVRMEQKEANGNYTLRELVAHTSAK